MSNSPSTSQRTRALLMLLLANFFWGLSFPVIKTLVLLQARLVPEGGTWFVTASLVAPRFLLAALLLICWQARDFWKVTRGELKQGVTIGLFAGAGMLFQNDGLQFTAASTSAFLTQFYAILIPVYVALRVRRHPSWLVWVCGALVLAGVAILGHFDWRHLHFGRGEWETLLSSGFFMGQILALERKEFAGNRPARLSLVMFLTQGLIFLGLAAVTAPHASSMLAPWTSAPWISLTLVLTVFCTIGAYGIMNAWQPLISATEAGLIYCIEPIFGSVMALFLPAVLSGFAGINYPNEHATTALLVGGSLITLANVLIQLKPPAKT
jgi:drug/metabolite transporter (DMT)-like permease